MPRHDDEQDQQDDWDADDALDDDEAELVPCPYCHSEIPEDAERCPYCENYILEEDRVTNAKPWWIVVTVIACLLGMFLWMMM